MAGNRGKCDCSRIERTFLLWILLCLTVLFSAGCCAESEPEWLQRLSRADGFEALTDGWVYQRSVSKQFTDGSVIFGLEAATYKETGEVLICVYADLEDTAGKQLAQITRMDIVLDESEWSWHTLERSGSGSYALLGEPERDFLSTLSESSTVQVQIHFLSRRMIVDFTKQQTDILHEAAFNLLELLPQVDVSSESVTGNFEIEHPVHRKHGAVQSEMKTEDK